MTMARIARFATRLQPSANGAPGAMHDDLPRLYDHQRCLTTSKELVH